MPSADSLAASLPPGEPLRQDELRAALLRPGRIWTALDVVEQTGSTNEDLLAAARNGAHHGTVLVAERQTRGRGRQGRSWISRPGAALTFSVLLRPAEVPPAARGWLPLLTGVAVARALRAETGADVVLKWPNDVLAAGAKLAGILAEQAGDAIVVGIGLNVGAMPPGLPPRGAGGLAVTSLAEAPLIPRAAARASAGASSAGAVPAGAATTGAVPARASSAGGGPAGAVPAGGSSAGGGPAGAPQAGGSPGGRPPRPDISRAALLVGLLGELEHWYRRWMGPPPGDADGCGLRGEYLRWCATVGARVRVEMPGGSVLAGSARGVDRIGRLVVSTQAGLEAVSAGDVVHVR